MTDDPKTEILSRAQGILTALFWHATSGHCKDLLNWERWRLAYQKNGTAFSTGAGDAATLRQLAVDGYVVATGGKTKAASHRLTWRGILASLPPVEEGGLKADDFVSFMNVLVDDPKQGMGWRLCPSAVGWVRNTDDPAEYLDELDRVQDFILPLAAAGYVKQVVSVGIPFWYVTITDAGRDFLAAPEIHETGTHFNFDAWAEGWAIGKNRFSGNAPAEFGNVIPYSCTTEIWEGMPRRGSCPRSRRICL